jgi:putative transport protein
VFAGATTNTPALGAAQQALAATPDGQATLAAMACATAYPLAVVGIIASLLLVRRVFKIDVAREAEEFRATQREGVEPLDRMNLVVENPNLDGLKVVEIPALRETSVVVSWCRDCVVTGRAT